MPPLRRDVSVKSGRLELKRRMKLPRPLLFAVPTVVLLLVAVGLGFGIPAYRQWSALKEVAKYSAAEEYFPVLPEWMRKCLGKHVAAFDRVEALAFKASEQRTRRIDPSEPLANDCCEPEDPVVNDAALACICVLVDLRELSLSCTDVSDAGIEHVCRLSKLEKLSLDGTDVSDASMPLLKRLKCLKELSLCGTRVSEAGVAELQQALPGLKVTR
jgi:hypothetical protein